jgi:hypothetical protein
MTKRKCELIMRYKTLFKLVENLNVPAYDCEMLPTLGSSTKLNTSPMRPSPSIPRTGRAS